MAKRTIYEWTVEELDEDNQPFNSDFSEQLGCLIPVTEAPLNYGLVRDVWDDQDGLIERDWAYVVNGKLPETFTDSNGKPSYQIPERFRKELFDYQNKTKGLIHSQAPHVGF